MSGFQTAVDFIEAHHGCPGWMDGFQHIGNRMDTRYQCKTCLATGRIASRKGREPNPNSWYMDHVIGHAQCIKCGQWFTLAGINKHISRVHKVHTDHAMSLPPGTVRQRWYRFRKGNQHTIAQCRECGSVFEDHACTALARPYREIGG